MSGSYNYPRFEYRKPAELGQVLHKTVVVVGAGPVGIAAAIDLAQHGVNVLMLDEDDTVSFGSRGLCYAKRTLEILDRLQVGDAVVAKGVSWNIGRTFLREEEVYHFDLLPEAGHERPAMINLQQYYLEQFLLERAAALPNLEIRWKSKVQLIAADAKSSLLEVETPDGKYQVKADWLIAADGAKSTVRRALGLEMQGQVFKDRFLIADVVMQAAFPAERWFWFDPPFHPNQSVLLHREADHVWRIDFQLGWDADPEEEKKPEKVIPRIQAMLGEQHVFELEWVSVYTFQCRRMQSFKHQRVLFVGDAAHQVSPFGARGANSGIQDIDNVVWKLKWVLDGKAPEALLDTYSEERVIAADENLLNSTRSTDFITPKSSISKLFRNAVLELAKEHGFARSLVNSGRLSVPCLLHASRLNTPDESAFASALSPGSPAADAPMRLAGQDTWLLRHVGNHFQLLVFVEKELSTQLLDQIQALKQAAVDVEVIYIQAHSIVDSEKLALAKTLHDYQNTFQQRYDASHGSAYLLRPDQHVVARWRSVNAQQIRLAWARATLNAVC